MNETLLKLYQARDDMAAVALANEGLACKPGCNACCHHAVAVTLADTMIVSSELSPDDSKRLGGLWAEQCERFKQTGWHNYRSPCSLLNANAYCSMYGNRPWPCRVYNSRDADACERGDNVQGVRPPWDRMFARLVQIAATQADDKVLTEQNVAYANRHYFMPAALLHVELNHWDGQIPDVYEYTPGPSQDKWERSLCKS